MDPQHVKRPRSSSMGKGGSGEFVSSGSFLSVAGSTATPCVLPRSEAVALDCESNSCSQPFRVDARKKKKKTKKTRSDTVTNDATTTATIQEKQTHTQRDRPHHKETATPEGSILAQVLTTFSSLEQSRFRAFRRSTFHADAVEAWVAALLQDRYGDNSSSTSTTQTISRKLEDLVAPGQAQDIGLVVSLAAKIYAQRLVAEAVSLHQRERSNNNNNNTATAAATPLPPTAVYQAVQARRRRGVDPGFFLQPATDCFNWAAATASYDVRRLAAEHAQAEYDKRHPAPALLPNVEAANVATDKDVDMESPLSKTYEPKDWD